MALSTTPSNALTFNVEASLDLAGAEIAAYDSASKRLFVTSNSGLQIVDISDPAAPVLLRTVSFDAEFGSSDVTSVSVANGVIAVAVVAPVKTDPGRVMLLDANGTLLNAFEVGALPDMVTFTPDGTRILVANEGEMAEQPGPNPEGSISVIDISAGVAAATIQTVGFGAFNDDAAALIASGVRLFVNSPGFEGTTVAQDLEPEYITVAPDGTSAIISLQEANSVAILDLTGAAPEIVAIVPLGLKDWLGLSFDPSDRDGINFQTDQQIFGMYMPDAIASFQVGGQTYFITANEGDDRNDFLTTEETARLSSGRVDLDNAAFPNEAAIKAAAESGRLAVSALSGVNGDTDGDGDIDQILTYGARSFSIFQQTDDGATLVFDSGSHIDQFVATTGLVADGGRYDDDRSDAKGSEPEGVTLGVIDDRLYAFVGLERANGTIVYDITDPTNPIFVTFAFNEGDVAPEGGIFVPAPASPSGEDLLIVSNEGSNSVTIYSVTDIDGPSTPPAGGVQGVFINEFHYDNDGTDSGEAIEVVAAAGTDLSGYSIVLYNGSNGQQYDTDSLANATVTTTNGVSYYVLNYGVNGIQNGAPDGIALIDGSNSVVQFLSFEGSFTATNGPASGQTSVDILVSETASTPVGFSLQLTGDGDDRTDFTWSDPAESTFGAANNGQAFPAGTGSEPGAGTLAVANATAPEGEPGGAGLLTFVVSRQGGSEGAVSVSYSITLPDGEADAADFAPGTVFTGTLNWADGDDAPQVVALELSADSTVEPDELVEIALFGATGGATISDSIAVGTILNDDVPIVTIMEIQGASHVSPLVGETVRTTGIVTAVAGNGFYLQDATGDGDIATSDAVFVFTSSTPGVTAGQNITLTGTVSEFIPGGASTGNLSTTQLGGISGLVVNGSGALPTATVIGAGGRALPTEVVDDDNFASFDPTTDGIDFFESLEGMLVTVPSPVAVAGTNGFGEIYTVSGDATNLTDRGTIVIEGGEGGLGVTNQGAGSDFNPERIQIDPDPVVSGSNAPLVSAGTVLNDVTGVIGYNFGNFEVIPTGEVTVATPSTLAPETTALRGDADTLLVATYNVLNLDPNSNDTSERDDDAGDGRFALIGQQVVNALGMPDIIGLQEVQDNSGGSNDGVTSASETLQSIIDAIVAAGGPTYVAIDNPFVQNNAGGGQPGANIRTAFLYNPERVDFVEGSVTTTTDPATYTDPSNPFFGARLPLVAEFEFNGTTVTVVNNHFSSKSGGTPVFGATQPSINGDEDQRLGQAQSVADFVAGRDNVIVLGDLNEFGFEEALDPLYDAGLVNLADALPIEERYSYIFDGNAQQLDHIFASNSLASGGTVDFVHVNVEFATTDGTASDHDPLVAAFDITPPKTNYTLQLLHFADAEAGLLAGSTAPYLAALVDAFEGDFANSITLAGGDNFIPGPFIAAGVDPSIDAVVPGASGGQGRVDIAIHNAIGVQASTVGNHEFDLGTAAFAATFRPSGAWGGADFPYLASNLDFSNDGALSPHYVETIGDADLERADTLKGKIAPSAVIEEGGELIGLVGVTTQMLESLSSTGGVEVEGFPTGPGANGEMDDMALLASQLQPYIDDLISQGVNKIILMSHLQLLGNERALAPLLEGVDIILAAGSNTRLGDADDEAVAFPGHAANFADTYPIVTNGSDGGTTLIVNTDNEFTYLGRLVVEFDEDGNIVLDSLADNVSINGAYASTAENVAEAYGTTVDNLEETAFAEGTRGDAVRDITDAVQAVIDAKQSVVYGYTNVYLEGERAIVRGQESNLGNLTADANADAARDALGLAENVAVVSIKNGGGIRAQIGTLSAPDPVTGAVTREPPPGNVVTQLDVENALRFDNKLMVFDTTAQGLLNILNSPNAVQEGNGGFIQLGGVRFSYDPDLPAGSRVQDVALIDADGNVVARIADDGVILPGAPSLIQAVVLNFTAEGGDGYNIKANGENFRFLLDDGTLSAPVPETSNFTVGVPANALGEQQAFAEYLGERYGTPETAFDQAETPEAQDERIQNLNLRADTVLQLTTVPGSAASEQFRVDGPNDVLLSDFGLNDTLVLDDALFDSNGDGIILFGRDGVINIGTGEGAFTVEIPDVDRNDGLRYLGSRGGEFFYADADVRPGGAIEGTVGDDMLFGTTGADVFFFDTALGLGLGTDRIKNFGMGDRIVTTTEQYDSNGDGRITFGSDRLLDLTDVNGNAGGLVGITNTSGKTVTTLALLGTQMEDGTTYYVYGLPGDTGAVLI